MAKKFSPVESDPCVYGYFLTVLQFRSIVAAGFRKHVADRGVIAVDDFLQRPASVMRFAAEFRKSQGWERMPVEMISSALLRQRKDTKNGGLRIGKRKASRKRPRQCPFCSNFF
jgi:hypothetical protein